MSFDGEIKGGAARTSNRVMRRFLPVTTVIGPLICSERITAQ